MTSTTELRLQRSALLTFADALREFLRVMEPFAGSGGTQALRPRLGLENDAARRRADLERVTVPAARALPEAYWVTIRARDAPWTIRVNPILDWHVILEDSPPFGRDDVEACINRAGGALDLAVARSQEEVLSNDFHKFRFRRRLSSWSWLTLPAGVVVGLVVVAIGHVLGIND